MAFISASHALSKARSDKAILKRSITIARLMVRASSQSCGTMSADGEVADTGTVMTNVGFCTVRSSASSRMSTTFAVCVEHA